MTLQARAIVAYPNFIEPQYAASTTATASTLTPTFSSGSWSSSFPLTNLNTGKFHKAIRSTDATNASTKFDTDFGAARPLMVVGLVRHNLTPVVGTSKVRVRFSNDNTFATSLYDSGWVDAYQAFYAPASLPWGWDPAVWTGGPTQMDLQHYKSLAFTLVADALYVAQYMRIEVDDTTNTAGYVQIGGVFAGPGFQPEINIAVGATIGWKDLTVASTGEYGVRYYKNLPKVREAEFTWDLLSQDQGMEIPFEMEGRQGISGTCYFVLDPTTLYHMHRWSFPCTLEELSPLQWPYSTFTSKRVKVLEKV